MILSTLSSDIMKTSRSNAVPCFNTVFLLLATTNYLCVVDGGTATTALLNDDDDSSSSVLINSTLACTRGNRKTMHELNCNANLQTAGKAIIAVRRLFYGTTPKTSGCDRLAPYENCCNRDPSNIDCVFDSDFQLSTIAYKCSGDEHCRFSGRIVNTNRGNCNLTLFPDITSFSFLEYQCVDKSAVENICHKNGVVGSGQRLYVDSDHHHIDTECSCVFYTECGASVVVEAMIVQLRKVNSTTCVEELTFQDLKDSNFTRTYHCADYSLVSNVILFNSSSNAVDMQLDIQAKYHARTKMFITIASSDPSATVHLKCGHQMATSPFDASIYCPGDVTPTTTVSTPTTSIVTTGDVKNISTASTDSTSSSVDSSDQSRSEDDQHSVTVIHKESNEIHPGVIAGVVISVLGLVIVSSQVIFHYVRKRKRPQPTPQAGVIRTSMRSIESAQSDDSDERHIYHHPRDTVRGRDNPAYNYNTTIPPFVPTTHATGGFDEPKNSAVAMPDQNQNVNPDADANDKEDYAYLEPPPFSDTDDYVYLEDPPPYSPD